jgi:hypothetical protein
MDIHSSLAQRVNQRFMKARAAFERFDDASAEREMVGPNWNVRDLAGHLAHWTAEATAQLPKIAAGAPIPPYDLEKVNAEVFRKNRRMSFVMLLPQLRSAEDAFLAALKSVKPDLLIDSPAREWIDFTTADHYDKHLPSLIDAAARLGR